MSESISIKNLIMKYIGRLYVGSIVIGFILFIIFVVAPECKEAQRQDFELFYGQKTYDSWVKLNNRSDLTYDEWYRLRRARFINNK